MPDIYTSFPPTGKAYFEEIGKAAAKSYNFFNPNDGAVARWDVWPLGQATKADIDPLQHLCYGYDAAGFFERHDRKGSWAVTDPPIWVPAPPTVPNLYKRRDAYTAFSHAAEAKSTVLRATGRVGFAFTTAGQVNLEKSLPPRFQFTGQRYDHSGPFHHDNQRLQYYWNLVVKRMGLPVWKDLQPELGGECDEISMADIFRTIGRPGVVPKHKCVVLGPCNPGQHHYRLLWPSRGYKRKPDRRREGNLPHLARSFLELPCSAARRRAQL